MQANEVNGADISKEDFSTLVRWMAPESIASKLFSAASDVWSFGVLQWEMKNPDKEPYSVSKQLCTKYLKLYYHFSSPETP